MTLVFDAKEMGEVCPRCERVFKAFADNPMNLHYATELGYRRRILRDKKESRHRGAWMKGFVDRILHPEA